jgi:hypothetical protein
MTNAKVVALGIVTAILLAVVVVVAVSPKLPPETQIERVERIRREPAVGQPCSNERINYLEKVDPERMMREFTACTYELARQIERGASPEQAVIITRENMRQLEERARQQRSGN